MQHRATLLILLTTLLLALTGFCPETALFRNLCVNLRPYLCGVPMYASAQDFDVLDLTKNDSFPNQKLSTVHPGTTDEYIAGKEAVMAMEISSTAFAEGGDIPGHYTCQGEDLSPPLNWSGIPAEAKSLALIVDDPDAPNPAAPKMTWVHWVLYNLPAAEGGLAAAVQQLPPGTGQGLNDWGRTGYGGPCPPIGRHRYFFKLYALDTLLDGLGQPTKAELERAMAGHILAQARLMGTYQKH